MNKILSCCLTLSCLFFWSSCIGSPKESDQTVYDTKDNTDVTMLTEFPNTLDSANSLELGNSLSQWNWTSSGDGENTVTIKNIKIISSADGIDINGFLQNEPVTIYNGVFSERKEYTSLNFMMDDGGFQPGVRMIMVDLIMSNPNGATSRWKNENGEYEGHYSNPYYFDISSVCSLLYLDRAETFDNIIQCPAMPCSYFSLRGSVSDSQTCFELKPGDEISVQVGFLIGNNQDGSDIELSTLAIGLSGSLNDPWVYVEEGKH